MNSFKSIRTSAANKEVVTDLTRKLNLGPENVIARIALVYSLSKGTKLSVKNIKDAKGKEYSKGVLLGIQEPIYLAMITTHYGICKTDKDIPKYIKMHVDHGLEIMGTELKSSNGVTGLEFLINKIEK